MISLLLAFLIGVLAGLRSLTPPAAVAGAAWLGWLKLASPLSLLGSPASALIFALLAVSELVADKLPKIPDRTSAPGLIARIVTGALAGACVAAAGAQDVVAGAALGGIGGVAGAFGGYHVRRRLVKAWGGRDLPVALLEDCVAVAGSLWIVSRFQ